MRISRQFDSKLLARLHEASVDEPWDSEVMARLVDLPQSIALVAGLGETPCGLALARISGDEGEILTIGVEASQRGQGIGSALLAAVGDWACASGASRLVLEVGDDNRPALRLYVKAGFERCGRRRGYYPATHEGGPRRDALILQRPLPVQPEQSDGAAQGGLAIGGPKLI